MVRIPEFLLDHLRIALLGEIYPAVRAIAVGYDAGKGVKLRYYLDREPTDFDRESIAVVATNLETSVPEHQITALEIDCVHSDAALAQMEALSGFVYARREY